jgi:hypothetical protein
MAMASVLGGIIKCQVQRAKGKRKRIRILKFGLRIERAKAKGEELRVDATALTGRTLA